jgi:hypothetical protein
MIKNCLEKSGVWGDIMIYDIFEYLAGSLTVEETLSLLLTNKESYTMYTDNKNYCDKLLVRKILESFGIKYKWSNKYDIYKQDNTMKTLLNVYWYFKRHVKSNIVDVLIYMIDNEIDNDMVFGLFASNCKFRGVNINSDTRVVNNNVDVNSMFDISLDDMNYILVYGCEKKIDLILNMFTIPVVLISNVIYQILTRAFISNKMLDNMLEKYIKYLFVKHCYGQFLEQDGSYIHSIITILIKYKKTAVLRYLLDKKNKYMTITNGLDYQYLVNKCIEMEDRVHLKILLKQIHFDNKRFVNKSFVIINTHQIIEHCKNAKFDYMCYLVENCLGNTINTGLYIDSICQGIELLILSKRYAYLLKFGNLKRYINTEHLETINKTIGSVYNSNNTPLNKRIYI